MKTTKLFSLLKGKANVIEDIHKLKIELFNSNGEIILKQFAECKVNDIYYKYNLNRLPIGNYLLKIESGLFTKFIKIKISNN